MSVVGVIIVYKCDGCLAHKSVHTEQDLDEFGATWFTGMQRDYCPKCHVKVEHQAIIRAERAEWELSSERILSRVRQTTRMQEVANVH